MNISPYIIPGIIKKERKELKIENVINVVANFFNSDMDTILSKKRKRDIVKMRHLCMFLIHKNTKMTLKEIGKYFTMDHTSVLHGCGKIKKYVLDNDETIGNEVIKIDILLRNYHG
jgi:chromosomal replication initiator protein